MQEVSICIPVFNFSIEGLLAFLLSDPGHERAEIIVIDDASDMQVRSMNETAARQKGVAYYQLRENIGRSRIRNLFLQHARTQKLLFLDCDVVPSTPGIVLQYLQFAAGGDTVFCGKINYSQPAPAGFELHWKYGRNRESVNAATRNRRPYNYFMTGNCLIPKVVLERIRFDDRLTGYGYEDLLFAIELEKANIPVMHVDVGAEHLKLDSATAFMQKTDAAVRNLSSLYHRDELKPALAKRVRLVKAYENLRKLGLATLLDRPGMAKNLRKKLESGSTALKLLDLYKLILFSTLEHRVTQD
jgi:glycosyltransferase involved in cell wall biosynthesis